MHSIPGQRRQAQVNPIPRREFLKKSLESAALSALGWPSFLGIPAARKYAKSSAAQPPGLRAKRCGFFGVQTHFGQYRPDAKRILDLVEQAGVGWIRDEVYWAEVEKKKGVFDFPRQYDNYIEAARVRGIQVLLILDFGNPLYLAEEKSGPKTHEEREAFGRYCREVVQRFKPRGVRHYEIWNEPNASTFWRPQPDAEAYARLLEKAFQACKESDPGCTVVGCSTSGTDVDFIGGVFSSGGGKFMDAVSVHPYCYPAAPEQSLLNDIDRVKKIAGDKPIWLTEIGYPTHSGAKGVSEEQQANDLTRTYLLARSSPTVERVFWYDFQNDGPDLAEPEFNFGLIRNDRNPKPAYKALKTLVSLVCDLPLTEKAQKDAAHFCRFEKENDWLIAAWTTGEPESMNLPISGRRVRIIERDGEETFVELREPLLKLTVSEKIRYVAPA